MDESICALCGEPIPDKPDDPEYARTDEHVPASQFYLKSIRSQLREPLWTVPSHRKCNGSSPLWTLPGPLYPDDPL
jgi:hypothetical protein